MSNMIPAFNVPVVILAGGKGTRLKNVLKDMPKALAPVSGKPFLAYLLDKLALEGFQKVVLCVGFQGDLIFEQFGERYQNLTLEYSFEKRPMGTGGALRLALPYIQATTCLVINGDSFINLDLNEFITWHSHHGVRGSILLAKVENASRYGTVEIGSDEKIIQFREKSAERDSGWINSGYYLLSADMIAGIPLKNVSLEYNLFPQWVMNGLGGMRTAASFIDIGTPESLLLAEKFFEAD